MTRKAPGEANSSALFNEPATRRGAGNGCSSDHLNLVVHYPDRRGAAFRVHLPGMRFYVHGLLSPNRVLVAAPWACGRSLDMQPPMTWLGFRGVAVVGYGIRCSKSQVGDAGNPERRMQRPS